MFRHSQYGQVKSKLYDELNGVFKSATRSVVEGKAARVLNMALQQVAIQNKGSETGNIKK